MVKLAALSGGVYLNAKKVLLLYVFGILLILTGCSISPALYAWLAVLVLPVNSALNPILYTLTTAVFKQQLRRYLLAVPTCSFIMGERLNHTQLACESAMSTSLGHFSSNKSNSERKRYSQRRLSYV